MRARRQHTCAACSLSMIIHVLYERKSLIALDAILWFLCTSNIFCNEKGQCRYAVQLGEICAFQSRHSFHFQICVMCPHPGPGIAPRPLFID